MSKHRWYEDSPGGHSRFTRVWTTRPQRGVRRRRKANLVQRVCGPAVTALTLAGLLLVGDYR